MLIGISSFSTNQHGITTRICMGCAQYCCCVLIHIDGGKLYHCTLKSTLNPIINKLCVIFAGLMHSSALNLTFYKKYMLLFFFLEMLRVLTLNNKVFNRLNKHFSASYKFVIHLHSFLTCIYVFASSSSFDGLFNRNLRHSFVPRWNYLIFQLQFFIVYFVAGLKKLDRDWLTGYSMNRLSTHWIFQPFTSVFYTLK